MSMKKTYLTLILINIVIVCLSQNIDSLSTITNNSTLKLSYNSSLTYPGLRAGIEFPFRTAHITKQKKSARIKEFTWDRFISANLSWYHQPNLQDNV